jgi:histone-lysine N-methyltransferase SETMAR
MPTDYHVYRDREAILKAYNRGVSAREALIDMKKVFEDPPALSTIRKWYRKFRNENKVIKIRKRLGRKINQNYVKIIKNEVFLDKNISTKKLAKKTGICRQTVTRILKKRLKMKKLKPRVVPYLLNPSQKKIRLIKSRKSVKKINEKNTVIITGDESYFDFTNKSGSRWYLEGEKREIVGKLSKKSEKAMVTVFISKNGPEFLNVLPIGTHVNSDIFLNEIIKPLIKKLKKKYRNDKILLHFDNARPHFSKKCLKYFNSHNIELLPHPPYSPDLSPCDFFLFDPLKKKMVGKTFKSHLEIMKEIQELLEEISVESYYNAMTRAWTRKYKLCIKNKGDYFVDH